VIRPDVFFISENNHQCTLRADDTIQGAPDLIVEIASEKEQDNISSRLQFYESSGVREVWVMTPEKLTLDLYLLVDDQFVHRGAFVHDGEFRSLVIGGKTISVKALFGEYLEQRYAFIE
jgi:Uma2 family endonuclease